MPLPPPQVLSGRAQGQAQASKLPAWYPEPVGGPAAGVWGEKQQLLLGQAWLVASVCPVPVGLSSGLGQ